MAHAKTSTVHDSPAQPQSIQFPPPQTFDILPPLHEILSRIDHTPTVGVITDADPSSTDNDIDDAYTGAQPLDPKDLPNEVLPLRNKCKRVPREIEKLPDVERSVEEQREEIGELEEGIRRRMEVLRQVSQAAEKMQRTLG